MTRLILMHQEYKRRRQLVFGEPVLTREVGGPFFERHVFFEPGQLFCLELWEARVRHGALASAGAQGGGAGGAAVAVTVARAGCRGAPCGARQKPGPQGAQLAQGLTGSGTDLASLSPDYYRSSHFKLLAGLAPRDPRVPCGKVRELLKR